MQFYYNNYIITKINFELLYSELILLQPPRVNCLEPPLHSNCRAEVGVKTVKRLITGNIGKDGAINVDAFQAAILQYRNTPDPITKISPAMCLFGRPVKDLIPILPGKYSPHTTWKKSLDLREEALRHRYIQQQEKWSEHTKPLPPLQVGDRVRIQNQTGLHPNKWDRTGTVIEVRQFHQYLIRVDGSGRQTLRNRKFLRKFVPCMYQPPKRRSILEDIACLPPSRSPDRDDTTTLPSPPIHGSPPRSRLKIRPPQRLQRALTWRPPPLHRHHIILPYQTQVTLNRQWRPKSSKPHPYSSQRERV